PIVVFSPLPVKDTAPAAEAGLVATVSDLAGLDRWVAEARRLDRPLAFHVEIDTGMGRCGFDWREVDRWGPEVAERTTAVRW
ncbi:MAG: hypothetical protein GWM90_17470, partial [Gemmatimonadetes bacterium]|nr:hypothetical protein [Gemmatimonadota bacterium]NIQ56130.1 hypothetical protein [Gemmatimonadota bacterium]NIU76317.1 hypothetical protein [Gammaproteobacteria bacterium]NIX45816.1 hypothetical protein [Gemmatimonadota bacterium]